MATQLLLDLAPSLSVSSGVAGALNWTVPDLLQYLSLYNIHPQSVLGINITASVTSANASSLIEQAVWCQLIGRRASPSAAWRPG